MVAAALSSTLPRRGDRGDRGTVASPLHTPPTHPRIPYGEADFRRIRRNRWLYVDKTRFLRRLEEERYAFLIRPRRFGKSLWISLLENYYDRFWADGFDATFAGTDIGQDPTGEQSRYVTLRFNFSMVNDKLETLEREFETYCLTELRGRLRRHPDLFPAAAVRDLDNSIPNRDVPEYLIDTNVRIDYGKLRHLLVAGRQLNGNFDLLRHVIGEEQVDTRIQPGFPLKDLTKQENFYSLLHYFGLLSIRDVRGVLSRLAVPNQTVKRLMYGYLRDAYRDLEVFSVNLFQFEQLMLRMATEGEWRPVLEFLSEAIARQTGIRDYIGGEKVIQGFMAAYLSVADYYVFRSEAELGKGHADIALEPLVARYPYLQRGYLIELKYFARRGRLQRTESPRRGEPVKDAVVEATVGEANAQLKRYLADDRLARQFPGVRFIGLIVVFHGWELVFCDEVQ